MVSIWNKITVLNPIQEQHVLSGYQQHKRNLDRIQKGRQVMIDNRPFYQTVKLPPARPAQNKIQKERGLVIEVENENLKNKLKSINHRPGQYNKNQILKQKVNVAKSLNGVHRVMEKKKIYEENLAIANRVKKTHSTVDVFKLDKDYKQSQRYAKNITQSSKRIYNCFLNTPGSTTSQQQFNSVFLKVQLGKSPQNSVKQQSTFSSTVLKKKGKKSKQNKNLANSLVQNDDQQQQQTFDSDHQNQTQQNLQQQQEQQADEQSVIKNSQNQQQSQNDQAQENDQNKEQQQEQDQQQVQN